MRIPAGSHVQTTSPPASAHHHGAPPGQRSSRLRRSSLILSLGIVPLGFAIGPSFANASAQPAPAVQKATAQADALRPEQVCVNLLGAVVDCPPPIAPEPIVAAVDAAVAVPDADVDAAVVVDADADAAVLATPTPQWSSTPTPTPQRSTPR